MLIFHDREPQRSIVPRPVLPQAFILGAIAVLSIFMAVELYRIVDRYAVNLIYFDQFAFMTPFFKEQDAWTIFSWQHGPRQGLGGWITWIVVQWSGWNTRAESFMILGVLLASLPLGLFLKRKLTGCFQPADLIIPLIILNKYQWSQLVLTPNVSPSVLPLLLIFIYALAWFIPGKFWRCIAVSLTNFVLIFTGFGLFMGIVTLVLYTVELIVAMRSKRERSQLFYAALGLGLAVLSLEFFNMGYRISQSYCLGPYGPHLSSYPLFMSLMAANFAGINPQGVSFSVALGVGFLILSAMAASFAWNFMNFLRDPFNSNKMSRIIVALIGYTLLFAAFAAIGRGCLGVKAAVAPRYVTLFIPGYFGLLLTLQQMKIPKLKPALYAGFALLLIKTLLPFDVGTQRQIEGSWKSKESWKACYLESEDYDGCNERTGFRVWKNKRGDNMVVKELKYLKKHRLNLYQDS